MVTFTKPTALASSASPSQSNGLIREQGNIVNLLFMAHATRPASPYADPSVKVDYIQQSASINASIQQQVRVRPFLSICRITRLSANTRISWSIILKKHSQSTTLPKATSTSSGSVLLGNTALNDLPWFDDPFRSTPQAAKGFLANWNKFMINSSNVTFLGWWTFPYYQCSSRRWLLTYTIPVTSVSPTSSTAADRFENEKLEMIFFVQSHFLIFEKKNEMSFFFLFWKLFGKVGWIAYRRRVRFVDGHQPMRRRAVVGWDNSWSANNYAF